MEHIFESAIYDENENKVLCACGNIACYAILGICAYQAWCDECSPFSKEGAEFVYKNVSQEDCEENYIDDAWVIDIDGK